MAASPTAPVRLHRGGRAVLRRSGSALAARTFDKANAEANRIMKAVCKAAIDYSVSVGITIDFIGWAETFTFDKDVQEAVNRRYIASQDQAVAASLAPYADTI